MLVVPHVLGTGFLAFGLDQSMPGLYFMLVLQMSAPGLMSSPALAAVLGLDVALTLASLIVSTAITPLTASLFTHVFLGSALASPFGFGLRLFLIIAGCALAAADHPAHGRADLHRGSARTHRRVEHDCDVHVRQSPPWMAWSIISVQTRCWSIELTALAFALALGLIAVTALVFLRAGRARAFAIGLIAGNRNIGLMLAASGFAVPDVAWLYFALAQFPIYLLPHLLKPLVRRLSANH